MYKVMHKGENYVENNYQREMKHFAGWVNIKTVNILQYQVYFYAILEGSN